MTLTRRGFLLLNVWGGAGLAWGYGSGWAWAKGRTLGSEELRTLGAAAEALIPPAVTEGADAAWARGFVVRRTVERVEREAIYRACAQRLESEARKTRSAAFADLSVADREATIRGLCPSIQDDASLPQESRDLRLVLREIMHGHFASDHLSIDDPIYVGSSKQRDVTRSSPPSHSLCGVVPDEVVLRTWSMSSAIGDYHRAWVTVGYLSPPGVCKDFDEITKAPR